jgi:uncharacterized protein
LGRRGFKRLKRKDGTKTSRVFILTVGFIVFLGISLYGLLYVKKKISEEIPTKRPSSSGSVNLKEVDTYVMSALFNLGVTIGDIESKKVYIRKKGEFTWEFKDIEIHLPEGITEKRVKLTLTEALSRPDISWELKKNGNSLISKVEVNGLPTHNLRFDLHERKPEKKEGKIEGKNPSASKEQAKLLEEKPDIREPERRIFNKEKPKVVIIVDDLGLNKEPIDRLLEIPASLSFAVLPNLPYSQYAARMAYKKGRDVILHLPMEPMDSSGYTGADAGDGVLLVGLSKDKILSKLEKDLASVPYINGVSNHMGSKFTENGELMELILERIKSKGLFFVDSKTSPRTTGFQIAKKLGMKTAERDVFLDEGSQGASYVRSQIERLINVSKRKGYAIGICHPYPDTVKVLTQMIPEVEKEVEIIPISGVVN